MAHHSHWMVEREARGVLDDVDVAAEVARDDVRRRQPGALAVAGAAAGEARVRPLGGADAGEEGRRTRVEPFLDAKRQAPLNPFAEGTQSGVVPVCELKSTRRSSSKAAARCGRVVCARSARPPPQLSWRTGTTALTQWRCICEEEATL